MSKLILKSQIEQVIPLCENEDFVKQFENRMHSRLIQIIKLRHGHTIHGKLCFSKMTHFVKRINKSNQEVLTPRHISKLYFVGLLKIKELMQNDRKSQS